MSLTPAVYLVFVAAIAFIYWSIPAEYMRSRASLILVASSVFVLLLSPVAFFVAVLSATFAWLAGKYLAKSKSFVVLIISSAGLLLILATSRSLPWLPSSVMAVDLAGSAFFALKAFAIISDGYRFSRRYGLFDCVFLLLFFPIYEAGPIETPSRINIKSCSGPFDLDMAVGGTFRIAVGIAKQAFVGSVLLSQLVERVAPFENGPSGADWNFGLFVMWILLKWLQIYALFSGYSDVAIGTAALFSIRVQENFNFPFLARNIQEFWQRWHMSLINFMSTYIYQPFVRNTGWRYRGLLILFLLTGVWHSLTPQYVLWGLLHAIAMILMSRWQRSAAGRAWKSWIESERPQRLAYAALTWSVTIFFVAWVSAIGSADSWGTAMYVMTFGAIQ